jgi:YVTN family beta-propeller protein
MKNLFIDRLAAAAGAVLVLALFAACPALAANPLNGPRGLALAANGNLYVANQSGNNIVVFDPAYQHLTAKTITTGISQPSGVAIDAAGNIYVSNLGIQDVTVYSSAGVQNTTATITDAINTPQAIAVDSIGNVYVNDAYQNVTIYSSYVAPSISQELSVATFSPGQPIYGLATHGQYFAWGGVTTTAVQSIDGTLRGYLPYVTDLFADEVLADAFDAKGNLYVGNANDTVDYANFAIGVDSVFANLSFSPAGIVVDNTRGRVYISNEQGNSIAVYSTSGALLATIQ